MEKEKETEEERPQEENQEQEESPITQVTCGECNSKLQRFLGLYRRAPLLMCETCGSLLVVNGIDVEDIRVKKIENRKNQTYLG